MIPFQSVPETVCLQTVSFDLPNAFFVIWKAYSMTRMMYMSTIWIKDNKDQIVHKVNTLEIHQNVSQAAKEMKETKILAKLAESDMVVREARYHKLCMTNYTNKYRTFCSKRNFGKQVQYSLENVALSMTLKNKYLGHSNQRLPHLSNVCVTASTSLPVW